MHLGDGLQPPGALVVIALHQHKVFRHLSKTESETTYIIDNDCRDPRTVHQRHQYVCSVHEGKTIVRVDAFGGAVKLSPFCPGFSPQFFNGMIEEFADAIGILQAPIIGLSSHGEHCGLCDARGITVAQRIWLTVDARKHVKHVLRPLFPTVQIYATYHRRYVKAGTEFQKTRVVDHHHPLFTELSMRTIMNMTDLDVVRSLAPELLERVADPC